MIKNITIGLILVLLAFFFLYPSFNPSIADDLPQNQQINDTLQNANSECSQISKQVVATFSWKNTFIKDVNDCVANLELLKASAPTQESKDQIQKDIDRLKDEAESVVNHFDNEDFDKAQRDLDDIHESLQKLTTHSELFSELWGIWLQCHFFTPVFDFLGLEEWSHAAECEDVYGGQ